MSALRLCCVLYPNGELAVAAGWQSTAERLLADEPESRAHGLLHWVQGSSRCCSSATWSARSRTRERSRRSASASATSTCRCSGSAAWGGHAPARATRRARRPFSARRWRARCSAACGPGRRARVLRHAEHLPGPRGLPPRGRVGRGRQGLLRARASCRRQASAECTGRGCSSGRAPGRRRSTRRPPAWPNSAATSSTAASRSTRSARSACARETCAPRRRRSNAPTRWHAHRSPASRLSVSPKGSPRSPGRWWTGTRRDAPRHGPARPVGSEVRDRARNLRPRRRAERDGRDPPHRERVRHARHGGDRGDRGRRPCAGRGRRRGRAREPAPRMASLAGRARALRGGPDAGAPRSRPSGGRGRRRSVSWTCVLPARSSSASAPRSTRGA